MEGDQGGRKADVGEPPPDLPGFLLRVLTLSLLATLPHTPRCNRRTHRFQIFESAFYKKSLNQLFVEKKHCVTALGNLVVEINN